MGLLGRLRESAPVRFASGVLGADKYRGYLEYHRRAGLADPPMTKDAVAGRVRRLLTMADRRATELGIPDTSAAVTDEIFDIDDEPEN